MYQMYISNIYSVLSDHKMYIDTCDINALFVSYTGCKPQVGGMQIQIQNTHLNA